MMQIKTIWVQSVKPTDIDKLVNEVLVNLGDQAFAIQYFHEIRRKDKEDEILTVAHIQWDDTLKKPI